MTEEILEAFGARIGELRKERGLSQEAFAREAGLDRAWLGRLERGTQNPSIVTIARLAAAFRMDLGDLLRGMPLPARKSSREPEDSAGD